MARRSSPPVMVSTVIQQTRAGMREILIARIPAAPYQGRWTFPNGPLEPGEAPEAAARRVLRGFEGLNVQITYGQPPFDAPWDEVMCRWRFLFGEKTSGEVRSHPFDEVRWVPRAALREYEFDPVSQQVVDWMLEEPG